MAIEKKAQAAATSADTGSSTRSSRKPQPAKFTRRFPRFAIDARLQVKMFQAGEFRTCWGRSTEMSANRASHMARSMSASSEPGTNRADRA